MNAAPGGGSWDAPLPNPPLEGRAFSTRRRLLQTGTLALLAPLASLAQTWPAKPLRLVVPFTPGGTTDFVTRLVGVELAKGLGQNVIVENKPGGGTVIGVDAVAKSAPDGYSLVTVANS